MAHTFFCPNCGKRFDRDESLAGKKARCKDCQHVFVIPAANGPRMAAVAPSRPRDDPYGLDERPSLSSAGDPYAVSDDDVVLPQRVRPVDPARRKSRRRSGDEFAWLGAVTLGGLALQTVLLLLLGFFVYSESLIAVEVTGYAFSAVSFCIVLLGWIVFVVVPFLESVKQGLLCLFVPFYSLYYLITRWDLMKRPFFQLLSAGALPILMALVLPAVMAARQAALRAQHKEQAVDQGVAVTHEFARPNQAPVPVPRPVPAPRPVSAPIGGIALVMNVSGNADRPLGDAIGRRIAAIAMELSPGAAFQTSARRQGNQLIFTIAPIRDPQAYADRINFGTVTSVQGRTITMTATPESAAHLLTAAPAPPAPVPQNAPAPRTFGPRRFPRRPPFGGPR